jgi:hypothetical protein
MLARYWLVASLLGITITTATAQSIPGLELCAARDVEVVTLIEDHGDAADIAAERLAKAGLDQMQARLACSAGQSEQAIAIYDQIIGSLGPKLSRRGP